MNEVINKTADMKIGWCWMNGRPVLYVQEGKVRRVYGTFKNAKSADLFFAKLGKWDSVGGGD